MNSNYLRFLSIITFAIVVYVYFLNRKPDKKFHFLTDFVLKSKCECITDRVIVNKLKDNIQITIEAENKTILSQYQIKQDDFKNLVFACDLFKVLRRGPYQKIISFSLFGKEEMYYNLVEANVRNSRQLYHGWTVRVYHDDSIDTSIICQKECLNHESNIDFCNVNNLIEKSNVKDFNYMLPMSWRWLPLGDDFVSLFISRDLDSCIFDREIAAVNEWLKSTNLFHIMRDAPAHGPKILGGMWGFKIDKNKKLAKYFYDIITSKYISFWYKLYLLISKRGADQFLLERYFWPIARTNATIHDSFHCERQDMGGQLSQPFPTKRPNHSTCFVGALGCCYDKYNVQLYTHICPEACRPFDHKDWIHC